MVVKVREVRSYGSESNRVETLDNLVVANASETVMRSKCSFDKGREQMSEAVVIGVGLMKFKATLPSAGCPVRYASKAHAVVGVVLVSRTWRRSKNVVANEKRGVYFLLTPSRFHLRLVLSSSP